LPGREFGRDEAAGAGAVVDDHRLTERHRELVADPARVRVQDAAGRAADDGVQRLSRQRLRLRGRLRQREEQRSGNAPDVDAA
jgi:hypothetical protein